MAAKREIFHPPAWHWTTSKSPYNINTKRSLQMLRINKLITNRTRIIIETIFCNCLAETEKRTRKISSYPGPHGFKVKDGFLWEFGGKSRLCVPVHEYLYSHHLSAGKCFDFVRRNLLLITIQITQYTVLKTWE